MENIEYGRILKDFEDYLTIDRQLGERTVERHMLELRRLFGLAKFNPLKATKLDIRNYLKIFKDMPANSYANILKTLRVFYRDYLGKGEVIEGFKFPSRPLNTIIIPSKKDIQAFYQWLKEPLAKALLLIYSTTGLRRKEALNLKIGDIDFEKRMIIPKGSSSRTKRTWITFYNDEAEEALKNYLGSIQRLDKERRVFPVTETYFRDRCDAFKKETGIKLTPQILREWFACEMGRLGVPDRYVDAFCGRVPKSVLARHYTDFSPEKLKEIYDKANIKILS
ncbi:MAG: tyrosine-type recombinase/integrase [candidate division WOR-3 bacterium]